MNEIEQRLADALATRANAVDASTVRPLPAAQVASELRRPSPGRKWLAPAAAAAALVLVAGAAAFASGLRPGAGRNQPAAATASFHGALEHVDALSATNAWAVGDIRVDQTSANKLGQEPLILHWDGTSWRRTATQTFPHGGMLLSVSGRSPDDLWAAGFVSVPGKRFSSPLIEHWDGRRWRHVHFAADIKATYLFSISVQSATDVWAVGRAGFNGIAMLHWNGRAWRQLSVAPARPGSLLTDVTAVSGTDAWADGSDGGHNLILHWNGRIWSAVPGPDPASGSLNLGAVTSIASGEVWAVSAGVAKHSGVRVVRWDGSAWRLLKDPDLPQSLVLPSITATSPDDLWVASSGQAHDGSFDSTIRHWNGTRWSRPAGSESEKIPGQLYGLSATSASDAWAVGAVGGLGGRPLILHWNGTRWKTVLR